MTTEADKEREARRGGLAYFGRMMASISHELNNVVTIVGEVGGLIEDMTALAERGRPLDPQRLRTQCERIGRQVERGKQLFARMNGLAHSADRDAEDFEVDGAVDASVDLLGRLAELRGVRLDVELGAAGTRVSCSRFELLQAVSTVVESLFAMEPPPGRVHVATGREGDWAVVVVTCANGDVGPDAARLEYADLLAERLAGQLSTARSDEVVFTLRLPARG